MGRITFVAVALLFSAAVAAAPEDSPAARACQMCRSQMIQKMQPCNALSKADDKDSCRARAKRTAKECVKDNEAGNCDLDTEASGH